MSEIEDCIGALTNRGIRKAPAIVFLLLGTMFVAQGKAAAAVLKCASHSLNREDAFKVKAIARSSLPRSTQSSLSWACWNPENAYARIETRQSGTPDGVKRWWEILCRREGQAEWHCDPAEFNQRILLSVSIGDQSRVIELSFDKDIPLERARALASQAVSMYQDPTVTLRECAGGEAMDSRWKKELAKDGQPIRVKVGRENGAYAAYLSDADVSMSVSNVADDAGEMVPCWNEWVVVD
jgi:hypothetical protein